MARCDLGVENCGVGGGRVDDAVLDGGPATRELQVGSSRKGDRTIEQAGRAVEAEHAAVDIERGTGTDTEGAILDEDASESGADVQCASGAYGEARVLPQ